MSNQWSGDGGFSKGDTQDFSSHDQGQNVDWEQYRRDRESGFQPQHEWSPHEPPTSGYEHAPQHRAEGGDDCGMGWASNPWKLLGKLVAWGLCIVVAFCILAFIAGCIVGIVEALS